MQVTLLTLAAVVLIPALIAILAAYGWLSSASAWILPHGVVDIWEAANAHPALDHMPGLSHNQAVAAMMYFIMLVAIRLSMGLGPMFKVQSCLPECECRHGEHGCCCALEVMCIAMHPHSFNLLMVMSGL